MKEIHPHRGGKLGEEGEMLRKVSQGCRGEEEKRMLQRKLVAW
jgi:hypothetical protein